MSRAARAAAAARRIHGTACGSCAGDVASSPHTVKSGGQTWRVCSICWNARDAAGRGTLIEHGVSEPAMVVIRDVNGGPDRLTPSRPAAPYSYFERSPMHRAAAALGVPLSSVLAEVADRYPTPFLYADLEGASPNDVAGKPWEFIGPDLRERYDAALAEATATVLAMPSPCSLCGRTVVPRAVQVIEIPGAFGGVTHQDAICFNATIEARNLGIDALSLRLSDHVGMTVKASDYKLTGPGAPGPQPFFGIDTSAIVADLQRRTEARQRAEDGPPRPNVLIGAKK